MPLRLVLLPLDAECNWMLSDSMHPGACLLSRALLCADDSKQLPELLEYIYAHQEELLMLGLGKDIPGIRSRLIASYPGLEACIDDAETEKRLNRVLRWAVDNTLPIITPQLYVNNRRLCDEDTDLGLDYALGHLRAKQ